MENLGKKVKEKVTGFEGIITSKHIYITGCNQYGVQATVDEKGNIPEVRYFDEGRLEIIGNGITVSKVMSTKNGCDNREHP